MSETKFIEYDDEDVSQRKLISIFLLDNRHQTNDLSYADFKQWYKNKHLMAEDIPSSKYYRCIKSQAKVHGELYKVPKDKIVIGTAVDNGMYDKPWVDV
jgi:hypothetical protein